MRPSRDFEAEYDVVVVGSGFGGSVAALRLAEKGYKVLVLEEGRLYTPQDFPSSNWNVRKFLFKPLLGLRGIMRMDFFRGLTILSGAGVGGGSLVYANTLITPKADAFRNGTWPRGVGVEDWETELRPFYDVAKKMLGVTKAPHEFAIERHLKETAEELGFGKTFSPVDVGIFFGESGKEVPDPYFEGEGPPRTGCTFCGGCMIGCRADAKNTLDKNYLYFAQRRGVRILADTTVLAVRQENDGYKVLVRRAGWAFRRQEVRAQKVVLAAGVLGTLRILLRSQHDFRWLNDLSPRLGSDVRTNSESLLGVRKPGSEKDFSRGLAIAAEVHPNPYTKIEGVRYPKGSNLMSLLTVPLREGRTLSRILQVFHSLVFHPILYRRFTRPKRWSEETLIILIMQTLDNKMRFVWRPKLTKLLRRGLTPLYAADARPPVLIAEGITFAEKMAERIDGLAGGSVMDLVGQSVTAHILGGCPMGASDATGVIDGDHQVYNYPGLYVVGGAAVPANLGANPSLTITAMAERAMAKIPAKQ